MEPEVDPAPTRSGRQTAIIAGGRIFAAGLSALWLVVAARTLSLDQFSDLALVLALGSALFFLADAGYSNLLGAHVAKVGAIQGPALEAAVVRRLRGSILALAILVPGYLVAANDPDIVVPLLFLGSLAGNAIHGSIVAAFRSLGRARTEATNEVVSRVVLLCIGWTWLANGGGVAAAVITYSVVELGSALVLTVIVRRWLLDHPSPPQPLPDLHWRTAMPIAIGSGFSTIYGRIDTWLVALLAPPGTSGIYAACYRITETLRLPAQAAGAVTLADVGRAKSGTDGALLASKRSGHYVLLGLIPATIIAIWAGPILELLFGAEFASGAPVLRILAISSLASAIVSVLGPTAAVSAGPRYAVAVGVVTGLNVAGNLLLVPRLGGAGAAWANVASEAALAALLLSAIRRGQGLEKV